MSQTERENRQKEIQIETGSLRDCAVQIEVEIILFRKRDTEIDKERQRQKIDGKGERQRYTETDSPHILTLLFRQRDTEKNSEAKRERETKRDKERQRDIVHLTVQELNRVQIVRERDKDRKQTKRERGGNRAAQRQIHPKFSVQVTLYYSITQD